MKLRMHLDNTLSINFIHGGHPLPNSVFNNDTWVYLVKLSQTIGTTTKSSPPPPVFGCSVLLIFLVSCVVYFILFVFDLCLEYPMLPVSLDCSLLIAPSVFSNVYFHHCKRYILFKNRLIRKFKRRMYNLI